jgi:hypothetical protein
MYLPEKFYSTNQIVRHSRGYTHFFDADAKRFFNSRIGYATFQTNNPFITLFVTSEKYVSRDERYSEPRLYSIRSYDSRTRSVSTVGEFQEYKTSRAAARDAVRYAARLEMSLEDQYDYALCLNQEYDYWRKRQEKSGVFVKDLWL